MTNNNLEKITKSLKTNKLLPQIRKVKILAKENEDTRKKLVVTAKKKEDTRKKLVVTAKKKEDTRKKLVVTAKKKEDTRKKLVVKTIKEKKIAEELDEMKENFFTVITHELKSPLSPVKSQSQLLLAGDYGDLNEKQKDAVKMIFRNEEFLNVLISNILDISKMKSNKFKIFLENNNICNIINESIDNLKNIAEKKHITISLLPVSDVPQMMVDKIRIYQVMTNLINNAIKFTPENGNISIEVKKTNNEVTVSVKDSGIGLSKEDISNLFTQFFQVEDVFTRKNVGLGLGLSVCKGIIEAHKGKIWAESEGRGKGSSFIFSLPIQ